MVENVGLIRTPTAEEREDYQNLGNVGSKEFFLAELAKIQDRSEEHTSELQSH